MLNELYIRLFRKLRGKGLGLGLFNKLHALIWQNWLQPEWVEFEGFKLYLPKDDTGMSQVLFTREVFEPELLAEFKRVVRPGMTVLDLGANVGYHTLLASRLVGAHGKVVAVEPELVNLRFLLKNVAENACSNVLVCPCAASDASGAVELQLSYPSRSGHSLLKDDQAGSTARVQRVGAVALDDYLGAIQPQVIKMDIEGTEDIALRGMKRIIADKRLEHVFIECNKDYLKRRGLSLNEFLADLLNAGFTARDIDGNNQLCSRIA